MSPVPVVSIVVPVFDDASTDATAGIIEQVALSDPRVRLVHHDDNRTAFQARRTGILTARGEYVLFLDGDDELAPRAAEVARGRAQESGADIVGFGVDVVERDGRTGGTYERRLQPAHDRRDGSDVLTGLFTEGAARRVSCGGTCTGRASCGRRMRWCRTIWRSHGSMIFRCCS